TDRAVFEPVPTTQPAADAELGYKASLDERESEAPAAQNVLVLRNVTPQQAQQLSSAISDQISRGEAQGNAQQQLALSGDVARSKIKIVQLPPPSSPPTTQPANDDGAIRAGETLVAMIPDQ